MVPGMGLHSLMGCVDGVGGETSMQMIVASLQAEPTRGRCLGSRPTQVHLVGAESRMKSFPSSKLQNQILFPCPVSLSAASRATPFSLAHKNPNHGVKHGTQSAFSLAWEPPGVASSMAGRLLADSSIQPIGAQIPSRNIIPWGDPCADHFHRVSRGKRRVGPDNNLAGR